MMPVRSPFGPVSAPLGGDGASIAFVATYPPRQCGIATFTRDLRAGVTQAAPPMPRDAAIVAALEADGDALVYPAEVRWRLPADDRGAYRRLARELNRSGVGVVSLQHEYGIYGGPDGRHVLDLLDELQVPVVATLHTILRRPSDGQRAVLRQLADRASRLVVMTERGREILHATYGVAAGRIAVVPHGVPDLPLADPETIKPRLGLAGRQVVLSFGLLSPNKRIELVLDALARIVDRVPDVCLVVVGATHPEVRRRAGEGYRLSLLERVRQLDLERHVRFVDRYVDQAELIAWLQASDIFVTAYGSVEQIASGTLSYALAAGKAIISTPYEHALELLADGRGVLVPVDDAAALADELGRLLTDHAARDELRQRAHAHGRSMIWQAVGARYRQIFADVAAAERRAPAGRRLPVPIPVLAARVPLDRVPSSPSERLLRIPVPAVARRHLEELSDGIGVVQHAVGTTPDARHGYCTDDVARALLVDLRHSWVAPDPVTLASARRSMAFLEEAFEPHLGRFRNFRTSDGRWIEEVGSEDCHGRAVQALGTAIAAAPDPRLREAALRLFRTALPATHGFRALRPWAYVILGCDAALGADGAHQTRRTLALLGARLAAAFPTAAGGTSVGPGAWLWPEPVVTYDNAVLPHALMVAGRRLGRPDWVALGLRVLRWLAETQTAPDGHLVPVGNQGWWRRGTRPARFDQQPIEATALLEAAAAAVDATGDPVWIELAARAYDWFVGANDLGVPVADPRTGGCYDGLGAGGRNTNQGAESTLCWLLAVERLRDLQGSLRSGALRLRPAPPPGSEPAALLLDAHGRAALPPRHELPAPVPK